MQATQEIKSAGAGGLSSAEAARLLDKFGPNEPAPRRARSALAQFFSLFLNPLVLILLIASAVSGFLGEHTEAGLIVAIVFLGVVINFVQTWRSQQAADRLREQVAPTASVMRDGEWRELPRRQLVPGDLIRLSAGDLVPADAVLLSSRDLYVQQAALTGESVAAEKEAGSGEVPETRDPSSPRLVFLGTSVVSGIAEARVLTTGLNTEFGDIARRLASRPQETEFDRGIRQFSLLITRAVLFLVLFISVVRVALHRQPLESLIFAVALAVGLTPEFLPMITSVTLARGAVMMARRKVIVKQLEAIQNLGSIDVLCSDKTGTITSGRMGVDSALACDGSPSDEVLRLAWLHSHFQTGLRSPMDSAILQKTKLDATGFEKVDEIPFDFERRRASIVLRQTKSNNYLLITKGAPEGIFPVVSACRQSSGSIISGGGCLNECHRMYDTLSGQGLRVLAIGFREFEQFTDFSKADECDLLLAGFICFADPAVETAADTIRQLKVDGVQTRILTGDSALVARHVCGAIGLDASNVVTGDDLSRMTDTALQHVVENTTVFARVTPGQKSRILFALHARGHVVAFMGDGINDAPSLHAADVGISVSNAVDVARDAARIILVEPGLGILHEGILEGRRVSANVAKYLLMGTSSNFGNMLSMAAASLFLPFLPMLPAQILLNNFLYDLAQITIPTDRVDDEYLRRPQRWNIAMIRNFMIAIGPISSIFDFLTFFVLLRFFHAVPELFHTGWFVESLATQTLVLFVIRTRRAAWRSRPSTALTATTLVIVGIGFVLPYSPAARLIGFVPLPPAYLAFVAAATVAYLGIVETAKRVVWAH